MTRACLGLLAGMYALQLSSFSFDSDYMSAACVAGFALLIAGQFRMLAWFCAGVSLFLIAAQDIIESRISEDIAGDSLVIDIKVASFPSQSGPTVSFLAVPRRLFRKFAFNRRHEPPFAQFMAFERKFPKKAPWHGVLLPVR